MYKASTIAPTLIVSALTAVNLLHTGSKVIFVSSESSSITIRYKIEGGGKYGHRASTTALNMVGKLLRFDLKDKGVGISLVYPSIMRNEMTNSVEFGHFRDSGIGKSFSRPH